MVIRRIFSIRFRLPKNTAYTAIKTAAIVEKTVVKIPTCKEFLRRKESSRKNFRKPEKSSCPSINKASENTERKGRRIKRITERTIVIKSKESSLAEVLFFIENLVIDIVVSNSKIAEEEKGSLFLIGYFYII